MNFCKNIFFLILFLTLTIQNIVKADDEKKSLVDEEELPLNNPFDGTQGSNSAPDSTSSEDSSVSELDNPMSLYNFKLAGIISGSKHSYISLVNQD